MLFIIYTMLAAGTAAGLLIRKFVDVLSSGDLEDTVKCATQASCSRQRHETLLALAGAHHVAEPLALCCRRTALMFLAFILDVAFTLSLCVFLPAAAGLLMATCCLCIPTCRLLANTCTHDVTALDGHLMIMRRLGFLGLHGRMVAKNCTTIEMFEKSRISPWPYDHGWRRNFQEVFGRRCGMLDPAMQLPPQ